MCSLQEAILTAVLLWVKTFALYPIIMIKKCSPRKYRCFSSIWQQGLNFANLPLWAALLIPALIALKHLMPVSSMWPIGPLVLLIISKRCNHERTGKLKFVKVGKWTYGKQNETRDLSEAIVWPQASAKPPKSRCTEDYKPGEVMSAKAECCWTCRKCAKNTISSAINSDNFKSCGDGYHANDEHTMCHKTPIVYLNQNDLSGISIITFSCIGFVSTMVILVIFINSTVITTSAPNLIFFSLILTTCCISIWCITYCKAYSQLLLCKNCILLHVVYNLCFCIVCWNKIYFWPSGEVSGVCQNRSSWPPTYQHCNSDLCSIDNNDNLADNWSSYCE